jgi:hypothetical protein
MNIIKMCICHKVPKKKKHLINRRITQQVISGTAINLLATGSGLFIVSMVTLPLIFLKNRDINITVS